MGQAVAARGKGDDYQARWFWIQICRLFEPFSRVERVEYETDAMPGFDDVGVFYGEGACDQVDSTPLDAEFYQIKFHVTGIGALTTANLIDPSFINTKRDSLLQRLRDAQVRVQAKGLRAQFIFHTNWWIDHRDTLAKVVSETDGRIDWHRLDDGKEGTKLGRVRGDWRLHLGVDTDAELATILAPLRLRRGKTLVEVQQELNLHLDRAGFVPVAEGQRVNPYDDLARKLLGARQTVFTRDSIERICADEGLRPAPFLVALPTRLQVGIRSFLRFTERLEDETSTMLNLLPYFEGRHAKSPAIWQGEIVPKLCDFLDGILRHDRAFDLHLHAHGSIAIVAGYHLDPKAGVDVALLQSLPSGRALWRPEVSIPPDSYPGWCFTSEVVPGGGAEVAVALNVTLDVSDDVRAYVTTNLPKVGRLLWATIDGGTSNTAILDGTHANRLAQKFAAGLRSERTRDERSETLHLFPCAPNGLLFFIGRLLPDAGRCVLYEHLGGTDYEPSLTLPLDPMPDRGPAIPPTEGEHA